MKSIVQKNTIFFALRIYIAYYSIDYGIAKLTGEMFNNITAQILHTELNKVDNFHLTWYWFSQNVYLSYFIGVVQILSGLLLLFNKTVAFGAISNLILYVCIFLVDITASNILVLTFRVGIYISICALILFQYRVQISNCIQILIIKNGKDRFSAAIALNIILMFFLEFILLKIFLFFQMLNRT
jgi:hypothetical protein